MTTRVQELIETLDALLTDLRQAGCHLVAVLVEPGDMGGFHSWRGGNPAILYSIVQIIGDDLHDQLVTLVRGETDDTE